MKDGGRTVIRAVLESDLERLIGTGAMAVRACVICGRQVGDGEIGGFVKLGGEFRVFCERGTCFVAAKQGRWSARDEEGVFDGS